MPSSEVYTVIYPQSASGYSYAWPSLGHEGRKSEARAGGYGVLVNDEM